MATATKIIFSGFGGQGVLTLGQVVADIALNQGKEVTWMPSYGAEMRGGTANCSVIISDSVIGSPIILRNIDILVAMNKPSIDKFLEKTSEDSKVFINSSIVTDPVEKAGAEVLAIDATNIAVSAGNARAANMVMMAGFLTKTGLFTIDELEQALTRRFAGKKELVDVNMKAVKQGLEALA
ncbi:MAG: 2-oxoacid:acceptor oxidoreductase family protein [Defluviitaleaceae bacterium]|nr:2-oxoacid:acceptor oxidoreductase family protein [Defluviitaleaceae bacterium]